MISFFAALFIAFLSGIGARDRGLLRFLCRAGAPRGVLLPIAVATACVATALAAGLGAAAAREYIARTRPLLAGAALVIAGTRLLLIVRTRAPREPTNSLGAAAFVFFVYQLPDAARFSTMAMALSGSALPAACGGALGSAAALVGRWHGLAEVLQPGRGRQVLGVLLMLSGLVWIDRFW